MKKHLYQYLCLMSIIFGLPVYGQLDNISEYSYKSIPDARFIDINLPHESVSDTYKTITAASGEGCAFSPDGRFVYVTSYRLHNPETKKLGWGQHIQKIDTGSGKLVKDILIDIEDNPQNPLKSLLTAIPGVSLADVNAIGVTSSNQYVAVLLEVAEYRSMGEDNKYVPVLFDANTGKPLKALGEKKILATRILDTPVFSQDGRYLMAMGGRGRDRIYVWGVDSGKLIATIQRARQDAVMRPGFAGLNHGQILYGAQETSDAHDNRLKIFDLKTNTSHDVFGDGWDFGLLNFFSIGRAGKMVLDACREGGDDETDEYCGNSDAYPRLFRLPEFQVIGRLSIFNQENLDLSEFVSPNRAFQWSDDDSHLMVVGEGSPGDTDDHFFALLFDTEANQAVTLKHLPIRKADSFYVTGVTPEKEFMVLGMQPRGPYLRIAKIGIDGN